MLTTNASEVSSITESYNNLIDMAADKFNDEISKTEDKYGDINTDAHKFFNVDRFKSLHVLIFLVGNVAIILCVIFRKTMSSAVQKYLRNKCLCFGKMKSVYDDTEALSDDYYDEIHLKFLIAEYQRCELDKALYTKFIDKS